MTRVNLRLIAALPALAAMAFAAPGLADSRKATFDACAQAVQKEFGESPVKFDKFRRDDTKGVAYGELQLSDGSVRTIRCRLKGGEVLDMKFRRDDGGAGNFWTDDRPPEAIYVEPKPKDEVAGGDAAPDEKAADADKDAAGDDKAADAKAADEKPTDDKAADGKDAAGGDVKAPGGAQAGADGDADKTEDADAVADGDKAGGGDETADAGNGAADTPAEDKPADKDDGLVKPRFMKVPGN